MRLRNKKTGAVANYSLILQRETGITNNEAPIRYGCGTLAKLNEDWEDVDGTNDTNTPLIKDEKIRKAVRVWAEANGVKKVTVVKTFTSYTFYPSDTSEIDIVFWTEPSLSNLSKDKAYTIAELCGEEEE